MDDFWKRVYETLMTPLPQPKGTELDKLFEYLRSVETPTIGGLPTAPEWMQRYVRERGLDRVQAPQAPQQSSLQDALSRQP